MPAQTAEQLQVIDARDLAAFLLLAAGGLSGCFNAVGPGQPAGLVDVVSPVVATVVDDDFLVERNVSPQELPLWFPGGDGWSRVDNARALAAGLTPRPLAETIDGAREDAALVAGVGLAAEREAELLTAWHGR